MGEKMKDESAAAEKDENPQNHLLSQTPFDSGMRMEINSGFVRRRANGES